MGIQGFPAYTREATRQILYANREQIREMGWETTMSNDVMNGLTVEDMFENSRLKKRHVPIQLRQSGDNGDEGLLAEGSRL